MILSTALHDLSARAPDATVIVGNDCLALHCLPTATLERLCGHTRVIATHGTLLGHPVTHLAIIDVCRRTHCAVLHHGITHNLDCTHILVEDPVNALLAGSHEFVVLRVELFLLCVLLAELLVVIGEICSSLGKKLIETSLLVGELGDLVVQIGLEVTKS